MSLNHFFLPCLLFACHKPTASPAVETQSTVGVSTPSTQVLTQAETPSKEALLAAGFCAENGAVANIQPIPLPAGGAIYELNCVMAAYQGIYEYAWADLTPVLNQSDAPMRLVGLPYRGKGVIELKWTEKARGVGDCGDWFWYTFSGDRFLFREHRRRACDDTVEITPEVLEGSKWPLVEGKVQDLQRPDKP